MQKRSIELIPRSWWQLKDEIWVFHWCYDTLNLPHLLPRKNGVSFLSPEELVDRCSEIQEKIDIILHLRSQDSKDIHTCNTRINNLLNNWVSEVLLVTWDTVWEWNILKTHEILIDDMSQRNISVALDLYKYNYWRFTSKFDYLQRNNSANIFSQPIFSHEYWWKITNLLDTIWIENERFYTGVTLIENSNSREYWKNINNIPESNLPKWETSGVIRRNSFAIASEILQESRQKGYSDYIMVMRSEVSSILDLCKN